ncbi:hypothetical protein CTAM01_04068 [Colletotrichum tamarilloi]|uniref:Uncharacterized protein n=1 Tax=Colletotrichum tamarilloi TaxID=1209934 RepID=A0ABQ9RJB6_9PEZI|nr:uncharacterized protein CTAM01_04068 [Colletotrichum tamarilloi]KAK1504761.1 hypothetical protein CTAM01_04068 [Colletotrichum tamarilloi]
MHRSTLHHTVRHSHKQPLETTITHHPSPKIKGNPSTPSIRGTAKPSGKRETRTAETLGATSCTSPGHSRRPGASQNESIDAGEPNTYPTTLRQNSSLPKTHEGLWSTVSIVNTPRSHISKTLDPRPKTREPKYPNDKAIVIKNPQPTFSSQDQ